jgi:hypothetical protein
MLGGMNRSLRSPIAVVALVVAAGFTLGACGDKADKGDSASSSSNDAGTTKTVALTEDTFVDKITAATLKARTSHVEMAIDAGAQAITAKGDLEVGKTAADSAMAMTMDMGAGGMGTLEIRLVDEIFYMNFGQMTQNKFAKIDLTDKSNPIGKQYGEIVDQLDPSRQMEQLAKALKSFEKKGQPQEIDGVQAQPYAVVVDTSKIADLAGLTGAPAAQVPDTITYTMFVGPDNLPRRIVTDVAGSKLTMDYSKWGEDVNIEAPPAGEISDLDLSKMMSGATGS